MHKATSSPPLWEPQEIKAKRSTLVLQIITAMGCRLVLNTARRFAYPFAPALSRGLQVPLTAVTTIIALMQLTGIISVLGGPFWDRLGYRRIMLAGMAILSIGLLMVGIAPYYLIVMIGLVFAGLAKNIFDPALYGYAGLRVPFNHRGRVIGILEIAWAGSALIGIPLMGLLIESHGWQAPFWCLGGLGVVGFVLVAKLVPADPITAEKKKRPAVRQAWGHLVRERTALGLMGFVFWASLGNDQLFVVYGAWMEKAFGMGIAAIGLGTGVIGAAELIGEGLTATLGDRIGLKKATCAGMILAILAYAILPFLGNRLSFSLAGLFLIFLSFEFSMVCGISLSTEALPLYRATMMAAFFAAAGVGRVIGALIGGPVWLMGGMTAVSLVSAMASLLGLFFLLWGAGIGGKQVLQSSAELVDGQKKSG